MYLIPHLHKSKDILKPLTLKLIQPLDKNRPVFALAHAEAALLDFGIGELLGDGGKEIADLLIVDFKVGDVDCASVLGGREVGD